MIRNSLITGLDMGSSKILAVAAEVDKQGALNILAQNSCSSRGISRGVVVDLNEAADSVSKALEALRTKIGRRPEDIYVNISSETIKGERSRGMIPISARGREVTKGDIDRCVNFASTIKLPFNREIVHKIVHNFSIDDQPPIKNPFGLYASKLACEAYVITVNASHIDNICKCINNAGYDVKEVIFTGIADGASLISGEYREEEVVLLDMGSTLTEVCLFSHGVLDDLTVIPIGAEDLKGDLKDDSGFNDMLARIRDIANDFSRRQGKVDSILITGGMSFADDIVEIMEEKLSFPVNMGVAKDIRGDISALDSLKSTTAFGIISYVYDNIKREKLQKKNIAENISARVIDIFNNYF